MHKPEDRFSASQEHAVPPSAILHIFSMSKERKGFGNCVVVMNDNCGLN